MYDVSGTLWTDLNNNLGPVKARLKSLSPIVAQYVLQFYKITEITIKWLNFMTKEHLPDKCL